MSSAHTQKHDWGLLELYGIQFVGCSLCFKGICDQLLNGIDLHQVLRQLCAVNRPQSPHRSCAKLTKLLCTHAYHQGGVHPSLRSTMSTTTSLNSRSPDVREGWPKIRFLGTRKDMGLQGGLLCLALGFRALGSTGLLNKYIDLCGMFANEGRAMFGFLRLLRLGVNKILVLAGGGGTHVGGCQNYGPFLDPYYNTALNIWGTQKGTINFDNHPCGS